jgi:hypothetical protein
MIAFGIIFGILIIFLFNEVCNIGFLKIVLNYSITSIFVMEIAPSSLNTVLF